MAKLVLIHGAWMGAWCWKRVLPHLREAGHEVFTPTLTGLGELCHLLDPRIELNTHVDDIVNFLQYQDLDEVVLVVHSYAGMPAGIASHRIPERLAHIIFLDAFIPVNGKSLFDLQSPRFREAFRELADTDGDGWKVPPLAPDGETLGVTDKDDVEWLRSKMTAHPIKTLEDPAQIDNPDKAGIPRTYIFCTENPPDGTFPAIAGRIKTDTSWSYLEVTSPHAAMITAPRALAETILQAIDQAE